MYFCIEIMKMWNWKKEVVRWCRKRNKEKGKYRRVKKKEEWSLIIKEEKCLFSRIIMLR